LSDRKKGLSTRALIVALMALAIVRGAGAEPYQHKPSGFECADQVAGFARIAVVDYEAQHPGLGAACKYRLQNDVIADVYVYTAGLSPVPRETLHPAMQRLRAQTVSEIEQFAESRGERVRKIESATLQVGTRAGGTDVLYDAFVIISPQEARHTWLWLWSARGHVMKIRMTRRPDAEPDPARVREFAEAVVRTAAN
jgi:hypothetical protein